MPDDLLKQVMESGERVTNAQVFLLASSALIALRLRHWVGHSGSPASYSPFALSFQRAQVHSQFSWLIPGRPSSSGPTFVPMMETTDLRQCDHSTRPRHLHRPPFRRILLQRQVCPSLVTVFRKRVDMPVERSFVEHDQMVQTPAAN